MYHIEISTSVKNLSKFRSAYIGWAGITDAVMTEQKFEGSWGIRHKDTWVKKIRGRRNF